MCLIFCMMSANDCKFNNHSVLVLFDSENNPWFRARDIAKAIGYLDLRRAINSCLDVKNVKHFKDFPEIQQQVVKRKLDRRTYSINESGLCNLILRSTKTSEARELLKRLLSESFHLAFTDLKH